MHHTTSGFSDINLAYLSMPHFRCRANHASVLDFAWVVAGKSCSMNLLTVSSEAETFFRCLYKRSLGSIVRSDEIAEHAPILDKLDASRTRLRSRRS